MSEPEPKANRVLELAEEFLDRYRKGERPSLREYIQRYPDLAAEIKDVFPTMAMMENIAVADDSLETPASRGAQPDASLQQLGDFRIIRTIGHGGMGVVYEAEQVSLGRHVALKVLPNQAFKDDKHKRRFEREARTAAKLHHTNIVPVFGVGEHEGVPYYVMQFIQGLGLDVVLEELNRMQPGAAQVPSGLPTAGEIRISRRDITAARVAQSLLSGTFRRSGDMAAEDLMASETEPASRPADSIGLSGSARFSDSFTVSSSSLALPGTNNVATRGAAKTMTYWQSVANIGRQVADALDYAHAQGILHRDIKPSNLLLDLRGTVWVTDFGLAKVAGSTADNLTHTGDVMGTLRYMPPEAFDGKSDTRSDVYSLGLTLYELLAMRPAFDAKDRNKLVKQVMHGEPARLRKLNRSVPRDLETVVLKAIARDPAHRYQTPAEMADDLNRFIEDRPVRARRAGDLERLWRWCRRNPLPASLAATIVLVFLAGFAGVFWQWREAESAREDERNQLRSAKLARQSAETARDEANQARDEANEARTAAEKSQAAAQAEAYNALLSEVKALRAGHEPGWREKALSDLARLAVMPTERRDLAELRTEAAATLGTPEIRPVPKIEAPGADLGCFLFSPDGKTLVTAGFQKGLDFWDVQDKSHRFSVDELKVTNPGFDNAVSFPDGQGLAIGTSDHGVVFTDPNGVRTIRAPITQGSSKPVKLALDANGERIAVAWTDGAGITVHEVASGDVVDRFKDFGALFAFSPDGRWLARTVSNEVVLLPVASKAPRILLGSHAGVNALALSPDGTMLATSSADHTTVLWDVAKRERYGTLRGHREKVLEVAFSPDSEWIATASLDYTIRVWDTRTGQTVASLPSYAPVRRIRWAPTGEYLATSTHHSSKDVFLYKISGRHHVQQWLTGHRVELRGVAAHPRLDRFATSGYTELMSWDLSGRRPARVAFPPNAGAVTALAYSPDGTLLASASWPGDRPREVEIRDANTGEVKSRILRPDLTWALSFDPTGKRIACGEQGGNIAICDVATGSAVQQFKTGAYIRSVIFLERTPFLVSHGKDAVLLFNLESGKTEPEGKVEFPGNDIRMLAADPERKRLVVGLENGSIASVSLPDLTLGTRLEKAHTGGVTCLALSPDGRLLASAGVDHHVVLRDAKTLETLLEFPPWTSELRDLTFDAKGRRLAVVGTHSDVDLWDLAALYEGLTALGLAWDGPGPSAVPAPGANSEGN